MKCFTGTVVFLHFISTYDSTDVKWRSTLHLLSFAHHDEKLAILSSSYI